MTGVQTCALPICYDPEKQLDEIERINGLLDDKGIILDCDPRNVNDKGVEQPTTSGEARPEAPKAKAAVKASAEFSDSRLVRVFRS